MVVAAPTRVVAVVGEQLKRVLLMPRRELNLVEMEQHLLSLDHQ